MSNQGETGRSHLVALASGPHEDRHVLGTQEVRTVGQVGVSGRLRGPGGVCPTRASMPEHACGPGIPTLGTWKVGRAEGLCPSWWGQVLRDVGDTARSGLPHHRGQSEG